MAAYYDPSGVFIGWKGAAGWTLTDALAGILITGATGGGKTSGPGATLRTAMLTSTKSLPGGCGGIVFCAKNGEADDWVKAAKKAGRGRDIIRIIAGGPYKLNFLDWVAGFGNSGDRGPLSIVDFLEQIASAVDPASAGAGDGENAFFKGAFRNRLLMLVQLCQLARLQVSLALLRAISGSGPQTIAQGHDVGWQRGSAAWHALCEAEKATAHDPAARADFDECRRHLMLDFPGLSDRTRGVIEIMFSSLVGPFLTRPLRPLFCEETTIAPSACFAGKILIIDIPVQEYGLIGKFAALTWKRAFQVAVMRRSGPPGSLRPVFLYADECQNFLSPKDAEYQAVARGSGGITCLLTQQYSSIRDTMGSDDKAENLVANLQTKFFCQNTGDTNEWASRLIGERYTNINGINMGRGGGVQGNETSHAGVSRSEQKRAYIEPSAFQKLRRGGAANNYLVDTVVFCGGKLFAGAKEPLPYKFLSFRQR